MKTPSTIEELAFEPRDVEIFNIPDMRTRITTVQNYFFPRLELLLQDTVRLIQDVYKVNPYETMTTAYRPKNRDDARVNIEYGQAYIGLCGKRLADGYRGIKRDDGSALVYSPSYLNFVVQPPGSMYVEFRPFSYKLGKSYRNEVNTLYRKHFSSLEPLLVLNNIRHSTSGSFVRMQNAFLPDVVELDGVRFWSSRYYLPVDLQRGLWDIQLAFIALYPLLEAMICLGNETKPRLAEMIDQFKEWWLAAEDNSDDGEESQDGDESVSLEELDLPELDSYHTTRTGLWWTILARDGWRCLSCGRTAAEHGVTLEVDHILPRSLGGTDDPVNLQTLCKKCNIGKSNRDATDLRMSTR